MNEEVAEYTCSQSALYTICRLGFTNYANELTAMGAYRGFYDAQFGTDALAEVTAAQLLPDDQSRGTPSEVALEDLKTIYAPDARLKWQMLKGYIEVAYPNHTKMMLEDAGSEFYAGATNNNWRELNQLMAKGASFLANAGHVTQLTAGNNMPAGFVAAFTTSKSGFDTQHLMYLNRTTGQPAGTVSKIGANNAIYRKMIRLSKDAPLALPNMPSRYNTMVFAQLEKVVVGGNPAPGFSKVYPVAAGSNLTVNDFLLRESTELGVTLTTDAGPVFICRNLLAGCAGTGTLLLYNQQENTGMGKLAGDDPQLVITNTSAVDVEVLVKVLTV